MVVVGGYAAVVRGACKKSPKLELLNESTEHFTIGSSFIAVLFWLVYVVR